MELGKRPRCMSCGNLTRFDVITVRRTKAYYHFTVGGELTVEDEQVLEEREESLQCSWCGESGVIGMVDNLTATSPT